jgi:hypothetical protein
MTSSTTHLLFSSPLMTTQVRGRVCSCLVSLWCWSAVAQLENCEDLNRELLASVNAEYDRIAKAMRGTSRIANAWFESHSTGAAGRSNREINDKYYEKQQKDWNEWVHRFDVCKYASTVTA